MTPESGFADLRLNRGGTQADEGFWPSFTDIMTVIVMIFLLAMVILLIRNMELVNELRATMEAERTAAELARATGEEKDSLSLRLIATENELSMLRLQLMRLEEQRDEQEIAIASQHHQLAQVTMERDDLQNRVLGLTQRSGQLEDKLDSARRRIAGLEQDFVSLSDRYDTTSDELKNLRELQKRQEQELTSAQVRLREADLELEIARNDFTDLKVKYDKLVRPARSPRGRYVVEVRYRKEGDRFLIDYKSEEDEESRPVSHSELFDRLDALKRQHASGLYIRIIFPEDSGLSYNEAWSFTSQVHRGYDYYFQREQVREQPPSSSGEQP